MLCVGQYEPRDRLLLCRGASGSAQITYTRSLTGAWKDVVASISCLLARCRRDDGENKHSSWNARTPARYDEGIFATNHNPATG